jgi:hypothetical protein
MTKLSELQMQFLAPHIKKQILEKMEQGKLKKTKKHKYNARNVYRDGYNYPSKVQYRRYGELMMLIAAKQVLFITVEDVKGCITKEFKRKKKKVENLYPVEITIISY